MEAEDECHITCDFGDVEQAGYNVQMGAIGRM